MKATNKLIEVETGYKGEVRDSRDRLRSEIIWSEWGEQYYVTAGSPEVPFFTDFEEALKFAETCEYAHAFRDGWAPSV